MAKRWSLTGVGPGSKECSDVFEIAVLLDRPTASCSPVRRMIDDDSERGRLETDSVGVGGGVDDCDDDDEDDARYDCTSGGDRDSDDEERIMIFDEQRPLRGKRHSNTKGEFLWTCTFLYFPVLGKSLLHIINHYVYRWLFIGFDE